MGKRCKESFVKDTVKFSLRRQQINKEKEREVGENLLLFIMERKNKDGERKVLRD